MRLDLAGRARRPRSSSATSATGTCRSTRSTRHERRPPGSRPQQRAHRDAAGVAPLHQGVLRQHDRDQVRRRGDGGGAPARGVRARRRAAQVRRHEPRDRARRRARDHRLHGAARARGRVRAGPARVRRADGRDREDGADRQAQQGHRAAPQPPRAGGGGLCGDDGRLFQVAKRRVSGPGRRRAGPRVRGLHQAGRRRRPEPHRRGLHPRGRVGGRRRRGALLQRQRRRGRGRRGGRARRVQGDLPDRRRGLAGRPRRSGARSSRETDVEEIKHSIDAGEVGGRHAAEAPGVRGGGRARRALRATSSTGASRIRCCWSCSRTPASAPRSGGSDERAAVRSSQFAVRPWSSRPRT